MTPDKRKPRPGGDGRGFQKIIALGIGDRSESSPSTPWNQAHHSAGFARDIVFAEFGYRHARALDYGDFTDRLPSQSSATTWWRAAP